MKQTEQQERLVGLFLSQHPDLVVDEAQLKIDLKEDAEAYRGLAIKILIGIGGIMSSVLFTLFLWLLFKENISWLLVGIVALTGSIIIDRQNINSFLDSLALGCYFIGIAGICVGVLKASNSVNLTAFVVLAAAAGVLVLTSSKILNFFSVLVICGCMYSFGDTNHIPYFIHFMTFLVASAYVAINIKETNMLVNNLFNPKYEAVNGGLLVSFAALLCDLCFHFSRSISHNWISSIIIILLFLIVLNYIIAQFEMKKQQILWFGVSLLVLLPLLFAPAICGAILILTVGFHTGRKLAIVLGIIGLIYFTGQFYYDLSYTLLIKSIIMLVTGILCFGIYFLIKKTVIHE